MQILRCGEKPAHLRGLIDVIDVMYSAAENWSFYDGHCAIRIPTLWNQYYFISRPKACTCVLVFEHRGSVRQAHPMLLGLHNCEVLSHICLLCHRDPKNVSLLVPFLFQHALSSL